MLNAWYLNCFQSSLGVCCPGSYQSEDCCYLDHHRYTGSHSLAQCWNWGKMKKMTDRGKGMGKRWWEEECRERASTDICHYHQEPGGLHTCFCLSFILERMCMKFLRAFSEHWMIQRPLLEKHCYGPKWFSTSHTVNTEASFWSKHTIWCTTNKNKYGIYKSFIMW